MEDSWANVDGMAPLFQMTSHSEYPKGAELHVHGLFLGV